MNNYSLNQILKQIEDICEAHPQVSSIYFGELPELGASDQILYPLVWLNTGEPSIADKTMSIPIDILVCDLSTADNRNEKDTLSDTLQIAGDIFAALKNPSYQDNYEINNSAQLRQIRDGFPDMVNGWILPVVFEVAYESNRCQIPN